MMRKASLVIGACIVLLVLAKVLGLFPRRLAPVPPPIPTTLQTTWIIKFHTESAKIKYDLAVPTPDKDHGGCQYATGTPDPKNLKVCQNDIVQWQDVITPGQQHDLVVFMTDQFLQDHGHPGTSVATFLGQDGNATNPPGLVVAPDTNWHEWYVVVIDRQNPSGSAHDDPRIKTGG